MTRIAFLPGDGIGREVLPAARRVLEAAGLRAEWIELRVGWDEWTRHGDPLPAKTLQGMATTQCAFFGAVTSKSESETERELPARLRGSDLAYESPILRLRREFHLHLNVRPVRSWAGNPSNLHNDVDLVLFRENSEDLYAGIEARPTPAKLLKAWEAAGVAAERLPRPGEETALSLRVVTRSRTEAICRAAFEYAQREGRRRITLLEKANVLRRTGGLVREVFYGVAGEFPHLTSDDLQVDAGCARVVREPSRFDVVVATNLFGDIFSDVASEVAGGMGLAPSANLGPDYALFEPVHGSAPDLAGQGVANPLAAVLAGAMMSRHLGLPRVARRIEQAVARLVIHGAPLTPDMEGEATTDEVVEALARDLEAPGRTVNVARAV